MHRAWQSTGKDLPLGPEDLYRCRDDKAFATRLDGRGVAMPAQGESYAL